LKNEAGKEMEKEQVLEHRNWMMKQLDETGAETG
jgi:hypothetical protein